MPLLFDWELYFLLLAANIIGRQVPYYIAHKKTGKTNFCESIETLWFFKKKLYFLGWIEEVLWAFLWTFLFPIAPFFAFGWLFDSLQDTAIAVLSPEESPYERIFKKIWLRHLVREGIVVYVIFGPLMWALGLEIKITALITLIFNFGFVVYQIKKY